MSRTWDTFLRNSQNKVSMFQLILNYINFVFPWIEAKENGDNLQRRHLFL